MSDDLGKDGKEYPLTAKQHAFVNHYRESGNASEAYRLAYNADAMKPDTVKVCAHKLLHTPKVQARLAELTKRTAANVTITAEMLIERNLARALTADAAGQHTAAVAAETLAAKLAGLLIDKVDQTLRQVPTAADHKPDLAELKPPPADLGATQPVQAWETIQ